MEVYLVETHLGGFYFTEDCPDYKSLYCEQCGDSDCVIGKFDSYKEALKYKDDLLKEREDDYDYDEYGD